VRWILDTSVLIGSAPAVREETAISAVSLAELHHGVLVARDLTVRGERLRRLAATERGFEAIPVDERVARSYGLLASLVVASGRSPRSRSLDLLIAATAHAHGAALLTHNADDLRGLESVLQVVAA
jgi:predicted nucleic acid-binding protein